MDYLERLDKALEALEKEADRMTGLAKLSSTLGEVADELSAEKRQIKDAAQDLKIATDTIDKNSKEILRKNTEAEELSEKQHRELTERLTSTSKGLADKVDDLEREAAKAGQEVKSRIYDSQKEIADKLADTSKELAGKVDDLEREAAESSQEIKSQIEDSQKELTDIIDSVADSIEALKEDLETFKTGVEKTEKIHTVMIAAAILLGLLSCCIPLLH